MRVVEQTVHGGTRKERVAKERARLLGRAVQGDHRRVSFVARANDLVEVDRLIVTERAEPEILQASCAQTLPDLPRLRPALDPEPDPTWIRLADLRMLRRCRPTRQLDPLGRSQVDLLGRP